MSKRPTQKTYIEFYPFKNMILVKNQSSKCLKIEDTSLDAKEMDVADLNLEM